MIPGGRDIKIFTGTMDQDTEGRYLGSANYRYLLNARSSITTQGGFGAIEDVMGNELVANSALPPGQNKVIGSYEDIAGQSCIYFVWNSSGFHGIYRWFSNRVGFPNGVIETIYKVADPAAYTQFDPNPLNFQQDKLITGVNLVDDLLYWTDNYNSPKMINIVRANETNKRRKFDLYINFESIDLSPPATFQTISLYQDGIVAPVASFNVTIPVGTTDIPSAINLIMLAYAASGFNIFVNFVNKVNYIEAEVLNTGIYTIDWVSSAGPSLPAGVVVPNNFYPDRTNTTFSYPAMSYQLIERIKYPPFCSPDANFSTTNNLGGFYFQGTNFSDLTNGILNPRNYQLGINPLVPPFFTNNNYVVPGPGQFIPGVFVPTAYVTTGLVPVTFEINYTFKIEIVEDFRPGLTPTLSINLKENSLGGPSINLFLLDSTYVEPNTYTISGSAFITLQPGDTAYILVSYENIWFKITDFYISGQAKIPSQVDNITNQYLNFRCKYIYKDFQHSVYGAISTTAVSAFTFNNQVTIDYTDDRLTNADLLSDIKNVVLSVSSDNNTTWFDLDTLSPYQFAGLNRQVYNYTGADVLIPVAPAEAVLPYHNVPKKSKSQEYIDDRIWDGNITTGYDVIPVEYAISIKYDDINTSPWNTLSFDSISRWKRGWSGKIGIVYYDDADRKTPVMYDFVRSTVNIPWYNDDIDLGAGPVRAYNPAYVEVEIIHQPPSWAKKYHLVRTQDLNQVTYLIWNANLLRYVNADETVVSATPVGTARYIRIDLSNIPYYTDKGLRGSQTSFTYTTGDRIRFITDYTGLITAPNEYIIRFQVGNFIYIDYDGALDVKTGNLFEIYSDRPDSDRGLYYEFGECYPIYIQGGVAYHRGNTQDQNALQPAIVTCLEGDVWYRKRNFYYNTQNPVPDQYQLLISSNTPSDYTAEIFNSNGRVNSTEIKGEDYQPTAILFSDKYISNTQINGLAAVQPLNTEQYSTVYGPVNKMQVVNNDVLKLVFGNSYQLSIYVSQGVIRQSQGGPALVSVADQVAGNSHIIQRTLGTINSESVIVNDEADMFGYDENEGVVWVASGNGLIQISDRGMKSTFVQYAQQRRALGLTSETPAVYDLYHDEYILTLGDMPGFTGVTIAYNKQKGGWTSYYSFVPEYYGRVRDYVVSFKDGNLWVHDRNTDSKNFYGVQYNRQLTYISNKDFPKVKDYKAISVNGIGANSCPTIRILPFQGYLAGMLSSLSARFFQTLEGVQYAYFQKDKLSPGFGGNQLQALINGRNLKGQVIEVTLENTDTAKSIIYSSDIVYFYSEHS